MIPNKHRAALAAAAFALGTLSCLAPAAAQKAGNYVATMADGSTLVLNVTGTSPNFTLQSANANFNANCNKTGNTVSEGWGFTVNQPIVGGVANFISRNDYYYVAVTATWISDFKVKGTMQARTATFNPVNDPPNSAQYCAQAKQNYLGKYEAAPQGQKIAPGTAAVAYYPAQKASRQTK